MLTINLSNSASGLLKQLAQSQPKALSSALNKTAAKTKTAASTAVRERYNISKSDYDKHMEIYKASPATLAAMIRVYGDRLSLAKFKVKWREGQAIGASVEIKRGVPKTIAHSFYRPLKNAKTGEESGKAVFMAMDGSKAKKSKITSKWSQLPIRKLAGPSAANLFKNREIQSALQIYIGQQFPAIFASDYEYFAGLRTASTKIK